MDKLTCNSCFPDTEQRSRLWGAREDLSGATYLVLPLCGFLVLLLLGLLQQRDFSGELRQLRRLQTSRPPLLNAFTPISPRFR